MSKYNDITELDCCPHCGGKGGYVQHYYLSGWSHDCRNWDGTPENTAMHDSLKESRHHKYYRCLDCDKRVAKVVSGLGLLVADHGYREKDI